MALTATILIREVRAWIAATDVPAPTATFDERWSRALSAAAFSTNPGATVRLVEFVDFECPVCAREHRAIRAAQEKFGPKLSVAYVHFPLSNHRHARVSAMAVECAERQGRAHAAIDVLFSRREIVSRSGSTEFAGLVGAQDTTAFMQCIEGAYGVPRIEAGLLIGDSLEIRGTPTTYLNGWRYNGAVGKEHLMDAIADLVARRPPRHAVDR